MKRIIHIAFAAAALVACHETVQEPPMVDATQSDQLQISSQIATRAVGNVWESGDKIGVYMFNDNTTNAVFAGTNNTPYSTTSQAESATFAPTNGVPLYYPQEGVVDILAYYPYTAGMLGLEYPINVKDQSDQAAIDLMSAKKGDLVRNREAIDLLFAHRLSRIVVKLEAGDGMTNEELVGTTVKLSGFKTSARYDLNAEQFLRLDVSPTNTLTLNGDALSAENLAVEGIVIPQSVAEYEIAISVPGLGEFDVLPYAAKEFKSGMEYVYTIIVRETAIDVKGDVVINDWVALDEENILTE